MLFFIVNMLDGYCNKTEDLSKWSYTFRYLGDEVRKEQGYQVRQVKKFIRGDNFFQTNSMSWMKLLTCTRTFSSKKWAQWLMLKPKWGISYLHTLPTHFVEFRNTSLISVVWSQIHSPTPSLGRQGKFGSCWLSKPCGSMSLRHRWY